MGEEARENSSLTPTQELVNMQREQRRYEILQRETILNNERRARARAAMSAGACILGAAAAVWFGGVDLQQAVQHEVQAIYSWEALGQYLSDLGPVTTLLAACTGGFLANYASHSRKMREAQQQLENMNAAMTMDSGEELGGDSSAKSR